MNIPYRSVEPELSDILFFIGAVELDPIPQKMLMQGSQILVRFDLADEGA